MSATDDHVNDDGSSHLTDDHHGSDDHSSSSSHIFGAGTHYSGVKLFLGFLICCLYLISIGKFLDSMEKVTHGTPYHHMLHNIYREIMMVGIGLFVFTILHETGYELPFDFYSTYSFVDICCFVMALFFCIQGVFVMFGSIRQAALWDLASKIPTEEFQLQVNVTKQKSPILWELRFFQLSSVRDSVEFRVFHSIFSSVYSMPTRSKEFDFGMYLRHIHEKNILSLTHISPSKWCIILFLTAIISFKLIFYSSGDLADVWIFTIGGFISSFFALTLMYFGRLSEIRLLNIAGVETISDYSIFLMTEVKTRSALQSLMLDRDSVEEVLNEIQIEFQKKKTMNEMKERIEELDRYQSWMKRLCGLCCSCFFKEEDAEGEGEEPEGSVRRGVIDLREKSPFYIKEEDEGEGEEDEREGEGKRQQQRPKQQSQENETDREEGRGEGEGERDHVEKEEVTCDDQDLERGMQLVVTKIAPTSTLSSARSSSHSRYSAAKIHPSGPELEQSSAAVASGERGDKIDKLSSFECFADIQAFAPTDAGELSPKHQHSSLPSPLSSPPPPLNSSLIHPEPSPTQVYSPSGSVLASPSPIRSQSNCNSVRQLPPIQIQTTSQSTSLPPTQQPDTQQTQTPQTQESQIPRLDTQQQQQTQSPSTLPSPEALMDDEMNQRRESRRKDVSLLVRVRSRRRSVLTKTASGQMASDQLHSSSGADTTSPPGSEGPFPSKKSPSFFKSPFRSSSSAVNSSFRCSWRQSMDEFFHFKNGTSGPNDSDDAAAISRKKLLEQRKKTLKEKMLSNHEKQNYEDVFPFFNIPSLYYWLVDFSFTCNSLYLSWWALNFVFLASQQHHSDDTSTHNDDTSTHDGVDREHFTSLYLPFLSLLPAIISFISLTFAIRSVTFLKGLTSINIHILLIVMRESDKKTQLLSSLREKLLNGMRSEERHKRCEVTNEKALLETMLTVCRRFSSDGLTLSRSEFMKMLLFYEIIYTKAVVREVYDAIDVNGGSGIEIGELKEFLFPMDISVENQRREKMFNDMNNKALRTTANRTAAKRIIQFINPKNIVNNPRRISGGGFSIFTSLNRRFSKTNATGNGDGLSSAAFTGGPGAGADKTITEGDGESQPKTKP